MRELGIELQWQDGQWEGKYSFPFWKDYRVVFPDDESAADEREPDEKAGIRIIAFSDEAKAGLTDAQRRAVDFLNDHQSDVAHAALRAIFDYYSRMADDWPEHVKALYGFDLPKLDSPHDLRRLIALYSLTVMELGDKDGAYTMLDAQGGPELAYVTSRLTDGLACTGLCFDCLWDDEHGLGVLMRGLDVIAVGESGVGSDQTQIGYHEQKRRERGEAGR